MVSTQPEKTLLIPYPMQTVQRAERALRCSPFKLDLFASMLRNSVPMGAIAGQLGIQNNYTRKPISELAAESALLWLIQVGILRREVDGQGITDSFRLTPLGRQLLEKWQTQGDIWLKPSFLERFKNALNRWLRLPI